MPYQGGLVGELSIQFTAVGGFKMPGQVEMVENLLGKDPRLGGSEEKAATPLS
jgi:hypothetical protein